MTTPHRTLREAAQMALDALLIGYHRGTHDAIAALREALAAPQAEPVAWYLPSPDGDDSIFRDHRTVVACTGNKWEGFLPLYAAPPAAPAPAVPASGWVWAHRKGGEYTVFGKGKIQCDAHLDDMADVVIYRSSKDGTLWARPEAEFNERFNRLRPLAAPPAAPASQWMPMDTAPKDGALFLCWVDAVRYGETDEGQQYEEDVSQLDFCYWRTQSDTPDGGWFDPCCGQIGDQQSVTHWMPLPAAPGAAPPAAPADDHATPSGGQEAGPQEDRIEAAYWRFDARHKGYSQWKTAPMSERDAFKAEMRNALESEKVRAEMRLVARGWRRPDAPVAPAPAAPVPDGMVPEWAAFLEYWTHESHLQTFADRERFRAAARAMIAASPAAPAAPVVREPLTDEQIWSMWMSSEFRGNGGQADWFCEGIRAAEAHHGITGGKP